MNTRTCLTLHLMLPAWLLGPVLSQAQEFQPIELPKPRMDESKPLMQALKERKSIREFNPQKLPPQLLSDLLWAGFGINRPENDHRTAPSAMNAQEIELFVATTEGIFAYESKSNQLRTVRSGDFRTRTGGQEFVKVAPVALVYVADFARLAKAKPEDKERYATFDAGCISQNISLFCASAGLASVVHDLSRAALKDFLKLRPEQQIIMAQSVGFPKQAASGQGGAQ